MCNSKKLKTETETRDSTEDNYFEVSLILNATF